LHELEIRYGQQVRQSWTERLATRPAVFSYNRLGTVKTSDTSNLPTQPSLTNIKTVDDDSRQMEIQITLREQNLGEIILRRDPEQEPWSVDDRRLGQEAAIQIASSLEYARLLDEIRNRALQESTVSQITAKVQQSLDLDNILKTAAQEIGLAINAKRVSIRLGSESPSPGDTEESRNSVIQGS
jgi:GAF domain-containing protein